MRILSGQTLRQHLDSLVKLPALLANRIPSPGVKRLPTVVARSELTQAKRTNVDVLAGSELAQECEGLALPFHVSTTATRAKRRSGQ